VDLQPATQAAITHKSAAPLKRMATNRFPACAINPAHFEETLLFIITAK
jgi:hypothetical protein